jgi:hypothetical protein
MNSLPFARNGLIAWEKSIFPCRFHSEGIFGQTRAQFTFRSDE